MPRISRDAIENDKLERILNSKILEEKSIVDLEYKIICKILPNKQCFELVFFWLGGFVLKTNLETFFGNPFDISGEVMGCSDDGLPVLERAAVIF